MSSEMAVSLALKLNDQGSGPAAQALQRLSRALKETEGVAKSTSQAAVSAFQKLAGAREILGIRSEKAIQNEIRLTEAAYQRLAASGQASARELGRAQDAVRQKVAGLRQEMEGVKSTALGMGTALKAAVGVVGAYQAGKMVLSGPLNRGMSYDRQLVHASNTMFAGQSLEARKAGMGTVHAAVKAAVQHGGTPEEALAAYQGLAGSGEYKNAAEIAVALPQIVRAASATGGTSEQFSNIALAAKRNLGLTDFNRVANMATTAGQLGGFEIKDMAKGLPEQLAAAKNAGLTGYSGYAALLALNQAAVSTAGTTDSASNNVVNILNKINSRDTANDFKKLGVDLDGSLLKAQEKGTNTLEAFGNLVDRVVAKDKRYGALNEKARNTTGEEQKQIYSNMAQIVEGAGIGKVLQDRQALMGFLAYRNQHDKYGQFGTNTQAIFNTGDSVGENQALVSQTASFKTEVMAANKALAMQEALDKVNPLLGSMADGITELIREYPTLAAATAGTTLATTALAASATAASLALALIGKNIPGLPLPGGAVPGGSNTPSGGTPGPAQTLATSAGLRALGIAGAPLAVMGGVALWADSTEAPGEAEKVVSRIQKSPLSQLLDSLGLNRDADIEARRAQNRDGLDTSSSTASHQSITINIDGRTVAEVINANNRELFQRH